MSVNYVHSPKVIVIAGPPASGKTYLANIIEKEFSLAFISLDAINANIASELNIQTEELRSPTYYNIFKLKFIQLLRELRYKSIVTEGCRYSHPHIIRAFEDALYDIYGEYTIIKKFYLNPDIDYRIKLYLKRRASLQAEYSKEKANTTNDSKKLERLSKLLENKFCTMLEPVLSGFNMVKNRNYIINWLKRFSKVRHPKLNWKYSDIIKYIAESNSYNPFYQTVELDGEIIINGFTQSYATWENMQKLAIKWQGKTVGDFGCHHGFFVFKAEASGAIGSGYDIDEGAIKVANYIALKLNSKCSFEIRNIEDHLPRNFDMIFALNTLHRVDNMNSALDNLFNSCNEAILEINNREISPILAKAKEANFILQNLIPSHRTNGYLGPRYLLHLERKLNINNL